MIAHIAAGVCEVANASEQFGRSETERKLRVGRMLCLIILKCKIDMFQVRLFKENENEFKSIS